MPTQLGKSYSITQAGESQRRTSKDKPENQPNVGFSEACKQLANRVHRISSYVPSHRRTITVIKMAYKDTKQHDFGTNRACGQYTVPTPKRKVVGSNPIWGAKEPQLPVLRAAALCYAEGENGRSF